MNSFVIWFISAFWFAQAQEAPSQVSQDALDQKLVRIEQKMANIKSLHCRFIQEKKLAIFDQTLIIRGEIFMQDPGSFAWHVHEPLRYRMTIRDQQLQQWDEDTGRVQEISLKRNPAIQTALTQMQAWFSGQYAALKTEYEIFLVGSDTLRFVPMEKTIVAGVIDDVEVSFLEDESYISSIVINESSGDQTALLFEDTKLNSSLPSGVFDAKPAE